MTDAQLIEWCQQLSPEELPKKYQHRMKVTAGVFQSERSVTPELAEALALKQTVYAMWLDSVIDSVPGVWIVR